MMNLPLRIFLVPMMGLLMIGRNLLFLAGMWLMEENFALTTMMLLLARMSRILCKLPRVCPLPFNLLLPRLPSIG